MYPLINIANFREFCKIFVLTSWVQVVQKKTLYFPVFMRCSPSLRGCLLSISLFIFAEWMFSYFICEVWHWRRNINMGILEKEKYIFCDNSTNIEENLLRQAVPCDIRQLMYTCNTWKDAMISASMMWPIRVMDLLAIKMSYLHVILD